jgi:D-alanyl-D-alanine carboxypeptidase
MGAMLRILVALVVIGCGAGSAPTAAPSRSTSPAPPIATARPTETSTSWIFPSEAFAAITETPASTELSESLQSALAMHDVSGEGGMSATVMTADGTWSGTIGKADGVRDVQVDDQFAVASITKSVVSAQVLLMAEAGELSLDDPVAGYLPADLQFDTNGATIRQLLGHRSGLPDSYDLLYPNGQPADFQRAWTPSEILALLPPDRTPPGSHFLYAETNYLVLQLAIEHVRGRPLVDVLRDGGSLSVDGIDRLIYQPEERPSEPIAMPYGVAQDELSTRGGYLPSLASVSGNHASGAIASDSVSLAWWWRALCAGEIVSQSSLTEMSTFQPADNIGGYGLGMYNPAVGYGPAFGHTGELPGYFSWAACLPNEGAVIVVLTNHHPESGQFEYSHGLARPLVDALRSN